MRYQMKKNQKTKRNLLIEDEVIELKKSTGNGLLRRQIWVDENGKVIRYSLAYINHHLFTGDNGRALGYDNAHGYHHRHYLGSEEPVSFKSFNDIEEKFQREFEVLHETLKKKK